MGKGIVVYSVSMIESITGIYIGEFISGNEFAIEKLEKELCLPEGFKVHAVGITVLKHIAYVIIDSPKITRKVIAHIVPLYDLDKDNNKILKTIEDLESGEIYWSTE